MHSSRQFVKKTRKGKLVKVVREHYLRDDIWCGSVLCKQCQQTEHKLTDEAKEYLVIDTNVVLHQMDLLERAAKANWQVIVPGTVLEEAKHRNLLIYKRIRELTTSNLTHFFVFSNEYHK